MTLAADDGRGAYATANPSPSQKLSPQTHPPHTHQRRREHDDKTRRLSKFTQPLHPAPTKAFTRRRPPHPQPHHPKHINMAGALARLCTRAWRSSSTALRPHVASLPYPYAAAAAPAAALLVGPLCIPLIDQLTTRASSTAYPHPAHAYVYLLDLLAS